MTGPLGRAAAFFLAPPTGAHASATTTLPTHTRAVVLGTSAEAPPLAAALALTLRAADRSPSALVAVWGDAVVSDDARSPAVGVVAGDRPRSRTGDDGHGARACSPARGAATPGACRLAARLRGRDLPAGARGRLAWLDLPHEPGTAADAVRRAATVVDGPVVTALAGARPAELDRLVEQHDLAVVVADPDGPLARAALAALPPGALTLACRPLRRGLSRAVALAGLAAPRLRPPLTIPGRERA